MKTFNAAMTALFELLLRPLRALDPLWALLAVSVVTGVLMLWIFGKVSDQDTVRVVRDRIRGNMMGIRMFGDEFSNLMRLQWRILRDTAIYLRYAFLPMLVMIVPVVVILTQLNLSFSARPLAPGERAVVKVKLRDAGILSRGVTLEVPDGVTVETPAARARSVGEVAWRIRADAPGRHLLRVQAGNEAVDKELVVGSGWGQVSTLRTGAGLAEEFLYPGEAPIDSAAWVESIEVNYPSLPLSIFGWSMNWLVLFFVVSLVAGFALKGVLGVEI